jgi:hypothetical protein
MIETKCQKKPLINDELRVLNGNLFRINTFILT